MPTSWETAQPQIAADALRLLAFGRLAIRLIKEQHRRQAELAREMIDDRQRDRAVIVQEPAVCAQHAKLQREPPAMVVAAAARDLREIRRRQAPMPRQFVVAGIGGQDAAPAAVQRRQWVIGRHSGASAPGRRRGRPRMAALTYDTQKGGYVVNLSREQLEGAPGYSASEAPDWTDVVYGRRINDYYGVPFGRV